MNYFISIVFFLVGLIPGSVVAQENTLPRRVDLDFIEKPENLLVGVWDFVETKNEDGKEIDTIFHNDWSPSGYEIPSGPEITLNADGTYRKQFTPTRRDEGKWKIDRASNAIAYQLRVDSESPAGKFLIQAGKLIKHADGQYYEDISDKVYYLSESRLILFDRGYFWLYKKTK